MFKEFDGGGIEIAPLEMDLVRTGDNSFELFLKGISSDQIGDAEKSVMAGVIKSLRKGLDMNILGKLKDLVLKDGRILITGYEVVDEKSKNLRLSSQEIEDIRNKANLAL